MAYKYPEKSLQLAAIEWMTANWAYKELIDDAEATGDRMDSIGILDSEPIAIEVKTKVHAGLVWHSENKGGSLEAKIAATVGGLYRSEKSTQISLIKEHWNHSVAPRIGILAGAYSPNGLSELKAMLSDRSKQWQFEAFIFHWTGSLVIELWHCAPNIAADGNTESYPQIPVLVGRQPRSSAPTLQSLVETAEDAGFRDVLIALIMEAKKRGFRCVSRPSGFAIQDPKNSVTIIAVFVDAIHSTNGVNVGINKLRITCSLDDICDVAPRRGFMNENRFLKTRNAATQLIANVV